MAGRLSDRTGGFTELTGAVQSTGFKAIILWWLSLHCLILTYIFRAIVPQANTTQIYGYIGMHDTRPKMNLSQTDAIAVEPLQSSGRRPWPIPSYRLCETQTVFKPQARPKNSYNPTRRTPSRHRRQVLPRLNLAAKITRLGLRDRLGVSRGVSSPRL